MPKTRVPAPARARESRVEELQAERERAADAIAERRSNVVTLDATIAAVAAQIAATAARKRQTDADLAALPERLRRAHTDVFVSPTAMNEQRVRDLERAETTLNATLDEIAATAAELHAERERLTGERDAAAELIAPLEQRLAETVEEIAAVRFAETVERIEACKHAIVDARQQLTDAHRTLDETLYRERASLEADGFTYLTHRPELASILGPNSPVVRILDAYIDFLRVFLGQIPMRHDINPALGPDQYLQAALAIMPDWVNVALEYGVTDRFTGKLEALERIRNRIEQEPVVSWGSSRH